MKIIIKDLKTDTTVDLPKLSIDGINIGHKITVNYLYKEVNIRTIEGVVCSIHHIINSDYNKITYINIY